MRLREMQRVLVEHGAIVDMPGTAEAKHLPDGVWRGWLEADKSRIFRAINELGKLPPLQKTANQILHDHGDAFTPPGRALFLPSERFDLFAALMHMLALDASILLQLIDTLLPREEPLCVAIQLPNVSTISQFREAAGTIDQAFNVTLYRDFFQSSVVFRTVDLGSTWIEILLSNPEALIFTFAIIKGVLQRLKLKIDFRFSAEHVGELVPDPARVGALQDVHNQTIDEHRKKQIRELAPPNANAEDLKRFSDSVDAFELLLEVGGDIRPALKAPETVQPLLEQVRELQSQMDVVEQRQLPAKKSDPSDPSQS